jgi:methyl-accepting chemotaxis protein
LQLGQACAVATLIMLAVAYWGIESWSAESNYWVRHTHEVIGYLANMEIAMETAETSARGFVLTGDESYISTVRASEKSVHRNEAAVRGLTIDNALQQSRLTPLERLIARKFEVLEVLIRVNRVSGQQAAINAIPGLGGPRIMNEFRAKARELAEEELRLLKVRDTDAARRLGQLKFLLALAIALSVLIASISSWSAKRDRLKRALAEQEMRESADCFRNLAHNISQLAWMADPSGSIFWYNDRWFDYSGLLLRR